MHLLNKCRDGSEWLFTMTERKSELEKDPKGFLRRQILSLPINIWLIK
jgi:hypothetical protein